MNHIFHTPQTIRDTEVRYGFSRSTQLTQSRPLYLFKEQNFRARKTQRPLFFVVPYLVFQNSEQSLLLQWVLLAGCFFRGRLNLFPIWVSDLRLEIIGFCFWGLAQKWCQWRAGALILVGKTWLLVAALLMLHLSAFQWEVMLRLILKLGVAAMEVGNQFIVSFLPWKHRKLW